MPLRFHWSLSQVGDKFRRANSTELMRGLPDLEAQIEFCRRAEDCGIDSVLMAVGFTRPDPTALSIALGMRTEKVKFMIACRPGLLSPTLFVQQINTVSALTNGRVCINIVAGHSPHELRYYGDWLPHDERYDRTDEFLAICRGFWQRDGEVTCDGKFYRIEAGRLNTPFVSPERLSPEIFLGGNSEQAGQLAIKHADCWWRFADTPESLLPHVQKTIGHKVEVGLLVSILARPTHDQAVRDAYSMIDTLDKRTNAVGNLGKPGRDFAQKTDSVAFRSTLELAEKGESDWLTSCLWTGAIPYLGSPAIALVGSPEEIASAIMQYKSIGVSQFLFMGWPDLEEMEYFAKEIAPLIRKKEQQAEDRVEADSAA